MKRFCLVILLGICLMLSLSCTITFDDENGNNSGDDIENNHGNGISSKITVDEQVILDRDGIIVTAESLVIDDLWGGPCLKVLVKNNRDTSVTVQVCDSVINGVMVDSMLSCDVEAGEQVNDGILFSSNDVEAAGIEVIKEIEFEFHVVDADSWDTIFDSDTVKITTSADPSFVQAYDDSGLLVLDQNGFKVVINSLQGTDVYLYIENNSTTDATIGIRKISVNGIFMEPIFSADVLAGKKAFDKITFLESDLNDNNIVSISELELIFHIYDIKTWGTICESEPINVAIEP